MGFELNDKCVANKVINDKQCTIVWHVKKLKISHVDPMVLEHIVVCLNRYGKEKPISINQVMVHDYLWMQIDFSVLAKVVQFSMNDYTKVSLTMPQMT